VGAGGGVAHNFCGAVEKHALKLVANANNGRPASLLKEASEVDRLQLKQYLQAAAVPEDRYLLVGLDPPKAVREGACIVRPNQRSWEVLMWEPASRPWSRIFLNEDLACAYALDVLPPAAARRPLAVVERPPEVVPSPAVTVAPAVLSAVAGKSSLQV
jgi:hypothetical protein